MTQDVRGVANFVLDCADEHGREVTNMDINKIVFFLHGWFLVYFGRPLVTAKIEAWTHGPVFRELYRGFRKYGKMPILERLCRLDIESEVNVICKCEFNMEEKEFLYRAAKYYSCFPTNVLREMSHVSDGPWHIVWNYEGTSNPGMEISNELIKENFIAHRRQ